MSAPLTDESGADDAPLFENEGLFTHWVCPRCGHNDWDEGDIKGDVAECPACGLTGVMGE